MLRFPLFTKISPKHQFFVSTTTGHAEFVLIEHGLICFQLAYFPGAFPLPNNAFRIMVICNRLLAYNTVFAMLCML